MSHPETPAQPKRPPGKLRDILHMLVGSPSYEAYLAHMAESHPGQTPMTRRQFHNNRLTARYGGASGGKCC